MAVIRLARECPVLRPGGSHDEMILDILIDQFTRSPAVGFDIAHRRAIVASGHGPVGFLIRQGVRDQSGEFGLQGKTPRVITIVCFSAYGNIHRLDSQVAL